MNFVDFYINDIKGTGYLAFRDLPMILHGSGGTALDFGCGAGRSSNYLQKLGFEVTGVDINQEMVEKALLNFKNGNFLHLNSANLPFEANTFDIVFNSFVLFDMSSIEQITSTFKEMKRVCKPNGKIISIVNSDYLFVKKWITVNNDFPQNTNLNSGDVARIFLTDANVEIYDYYWTANDYEQCFRRAGFSQIEKLEPLGKLDEGYDWEDELLFPPYTVYYVTK